MLFCGVLVVIEGRQPLVKDVCPVDVLVGHVRPEGPLLFVLARSRGRKTVVSRRSRLTCILPQKGDYTSWYGAVFMHESFS